MVVDRDAFEILRQGRLDELNVRRIRAVDLDRDQARNRQRLQRAGLSEPRLEQLGAVVGGERLHLGDALLLGEEQRHQRHLLLDVGGIDRIELDRDLAGDIVDPSVGRLIDHVHRAQGEGGEERHDGDHHGERIAGDRGRRHDLGGFGLEARGQQVGEPCRQEPGEEARPRIVPDVVEQGHGGHRICKWPS